MNLKLSFSWVGLVIFALPMLINIVYVMFPPAGKAEQTAAVTHWVEIVEQISRIAYLFAVTLLVSRETLSFRSVCGSFPGAVLRRVAPLFYGRTGDRASESFVSLCPDAAGSVSCAVLSVRRHLAA